MKKISSVFKFVYTLENWSAKVKSKQSDWDSIS